MKFRSEPKFGQGTGMVMQHIATGLYRMKDIYTAGNPVSRSRDVGTGEYTVYEYLPQLHFESN